MYLLVSYDGECSEGRDQRRSSYLAIWLHELCRAGMELGKAHADVIAFLLQLSLRPELKVYAFNFSPSVVKQRALKFDRHGAIPLELVVEASTSCPHHIS